MFFRGSRYEHVPDATWTDPTGRTLRHKRIRFIPPAQVQGQHLVAQGDRLDRLSFRFYRDADRAWRIADANLALWPDDLIEPGRVLDVPTPEG
ncbi:MAG TPA: hypothetical protein VM241_04780 [Candidatus Thermoplasmatota archaeon]|nr:hypothetical protein [Candidatus Thermoplasmatota archaeon]